MVKVVNTHHFGGVDKLPSNVVYIGRPGPHGNNHSSQSGEYSKEDCVAFHRVDLYFDLINKPGYFAQLKAELDGRDLACWCKQPKTLKACHGDNYLHIFKPEIRDRLYDKTVFFYLLDDLRRVLKALDTYIQKTLLDDEFLPVYIAFGDVKLDVGEVLRLFQERETDAYMRCVWLATLVVDLELAVQEPDIPNKLFRMDHCIWNCFRFTFRPQGRIEEPMPPNSKIRKLKLKDTKHGTD